MASDNRISLEITAAQKTAIVDAVTALKAALTGITINLTKEERQALPKIGDKTLAFDEKCQAYMTSRPELGAGLHRHGGTGQGPQTHRRPAALPARGSPDLRSH